MQIRNNSFEQSSSSCHVHDITSFYLITVVLHDDARPFDPGTLVLQAGRSSEFQKSVPRQSDKVQVISFPKN